MPPAEHSSVLQSAALPNRRAGGPVGRFAPSPTGPLHTGSLTAAVGSWLAARSRGGLWKLRIDDLDTPRVIAGTADDIMETLESFGLTWDGAVSWQSAAISDYQDAFGQLLSSGDVYPCGCSRREIARTASAPHQDDDCLTYAGTCRSGMKDGAVIRSWRIRVTDDPIRFHDLRLGEVCQNLALSGGDFAVRRGDGVFSYQLAVVVDDHLAGVDQVVRGVDLLPSTGRQIRLQELLGIPRPAYCHLPLVTAPGGQKLSKRDNLVSGRLSGDERYRRKLLAAVLTFLGMCPPAGIETGTCEEILKWGIAHFEISAMPPANGELPLSNRADTSPETETGTARN